MADPKLNRQQALNFATEAVEKADLPPVPTSKLMLLISSVTDLAQETYKIGYAYGYDDGTRTTKSGLKSNHEVALQHAAEHLMQADARIAELEALVKELQS